MNTIQNLNESLSSVNQIEVISHEKFKQIHFDNPESTLFERFIASVDRVEEVENGYKFIYTKNGRTHKLFVNFNGESKCSEKTEYKLNVDNGHVRVTKIGTSIFVEKLIGTAWLILIDELPKSFRGLCVNVMDCSGNFDTIEKFGLEKMDLSLDNLEWTLNSRNLVHGRMMHDIFNEIGDVYRISANSTVFAEAWSLKNYNIINLYLKNIYEQVK